MISASFTYDGAHLFRPREQVLSLVGATGSSTVTFLLPGFAAMKLFKARRPGLARLGAVQLALGCILMPISLLLIILGKASH